MTGSWGREAKPRSGWERRSRALGGGDRQANREMGLPDAWRPQQHDIFPALQEAQGVEAIDLLALERGLKADVEVGERLPSTSATHFTTTASSVRTT